MPNWRRILRIRPFPQLAPEVWDAFVEQMAAQLKHISSMALATVGSRVLGLLRDVFIFAILGVGPVNSAFVLAFTLPNLFRRLLGEGALTSALIPVLSAEVSRNGRASGFAVLNRVLSRLIIVLLGITAVGCAFLLLVQAIPGLEARWYLGSTLSLVLLPYLIFICLAAIISAQLNVLDRFFVPAMTPILLNLSMIGGLGFSVWWAQEADPERRVWWLCGGVLVGGMLQLAVPWGALRREDWRARLDLSTTEDTREVTRLFLPGVVGAAIFQVNIIVSRMLAYTLNEDAAGILYLANRLVELPLGVFAISVTTVFFPLMARQAAAGDAVVFFRTYERGLRLIAAITLPAAIGLMVLAEPILRTLFEWGLFETADVVRTAWPLAIFSLGLPFYAWASFATRGLHSWREMVAPVKIGAVNAILNLVLSLLLMGPLGESGLALANVLAGILFNVLLERCLRRRAGQTAVSAGFGSALWRMFIAAAGMGIAVWLAAGAITLWLGPGKLAAAVTVCCGLPLGAGCYALALWSLHVPELSELLRLLKRRTPVTTTEETNP